MCVSFSPHLCCAFCFSLCLSVWLSLSFSLSFSLCLSCLFSVSLCLSRLSLSLFLYVSVCMSLSLSVTLSLPLFLCVSLSLRLSSCFIPRMGDKELWDVPAPVPAGGVLLPLLPVSLHLPHHCHHHRALSGDTKENRSKRSVGSTGSPC